jgi:hypothetical protein
MSPLLPPTGRPSAGIALTPDCLVNPASPRYAHLELAPTDLVGVLGRCGFGLLQLPSHVARDPEEGQGVTGVARDSAAYVRAGFVVVVIAVAQVPHGAVWRPALHRELARWGVDALPELVLDASDFATPDVEAFLADQLRADQPRAAVSASVRVGTKR